MTPAPSLCGSIGLDGPAVAPVGVIANVFGMKKSLLLGLLVIGGLTACDSRKAEIDAETRETKEALEADSKQLDRQTREAKEQAEIEAKVDKVRIEADQQAAKAQIEADKKKAEAEAEARKKELDIRKDND